MLSAVQHKSFAAMDKHPNGPEVELSSQYVVLHKWVKPNTPNPLEVSMTSIACRQILAVLYSSTGTMIRCGISEDSGWVAPCKAMPKGNAGWVFPFI